jgi:hypothetical protein
MTLIQMLGAAGFSATAEKLMMGATQLLTGTRA